MAGNEVSLIDEVGGLDGSLAESQVRNGNAAGLLGVISEICLSEEVGVVADDLDGVLVCTDGTVSAETPELAGGSAGRSGVELLLDSEGQVGNVVLNADGEAGLVGILPACVPVNSLDLCRSGVLGAEAVSAACNGDIVELGALESCNYVEVERLAQGAGLLGSVKNGNLLAGIGDSSHQLVSAEGSVKSNLNKAELCALVGVQVVDGLLDGVTYRAHSNDNVCCIGSAVVVEELIVSADLGIYLAHILLYDAGDSVIVGVAGLASLEEDIAVLSGTAEYGVLRVDSSLSECLDSVHINHLGNVLLIPYLDLLDLVRGTEAVEEVQEGNSALDGGKMCNSTEIHYLLHVGRAEHSESGLTTCVDIGVVAEDVQSV